MPIGNDVYTDILTSRFRIINGAWPGYTFAGGGGFQFGLRKSAKWVAEAVSRMATEGRAWQDAKTLKAEVELLQDKYQYFKNWMLLSQFFFQLQSENSDGTWWNFVENTSDASPNGSALVSCEPEFLCTPTEISLKGTLSTKIYPDEYDWMLANNTKHAGGTGTTGSASGATAMTYDATQYGIPGIRHMYIGSVTATDGIGVRNSSKVSIKFEKQDEDERVRSIVRHALVDIETNMLQGKFTTQQVIETYRNSDFVFKVVLVNGMILQFHQCLSIVPSPEFDDDKTFVKLKLQGKIPFDPITSQANIVFTDGTSTVDFYRVGYDA